MKLTWVNHASFMLELGNCHLICDPWIEGTAFNNGWNLLAPTKFSYGDFSQITHIWFSHEHPDHFSPPNLKNIPLEFRKRITVLFHETKDKRVINVCKSLGFATREMPPGQWLEVVSGTKLLCDRHGQLDSWLAVNHQGTTLLNMNDCFYRHPEKLRPVANLVPNPDVLLTQFSYANWVGNRDDTQAHQEGAQQKINELTHQVRTFQPRTLIPFASFVWFSHEENYYMNRDVNRIQDICDYGTNVLGVKTLVFYPGDEWTIGTEHDSTAALSKYAKHFEEVLSGKLPLNRSETHPLPVLQKAMDDFRAKALARNNSVALWGLPAALAYVTDLGLLLRVSFRSGLEIVSGEPKDADLMLASDSLRYCLNFDWGGDTLEVNGRYEVPEGGHPQRLLRIFRIASLNSSGERLNGFLLARKAFARVTRAA